MTPTSNRTLERCCVPFTAPPFRAAALTLALAAAPGLASSGAAQGRSAEDSRTIESYRLTMPMLRKVLPAMYAPGAGRCEQRPHRDPMSLSVAEMTRTLEACSPVMQALRRAGVPARDAAIVFGSMLRTAQAVAIQGGKATALPAGPLRDNALLLEQHDAELRRLSQTGGQS
jgi:hypothetical protein